LALIFLKQVRAPATLKKDLAPSQFMSGAKKKFLIVAAAGCAIIAFALVKLVFTLAGS
jgi:hypothetical protein